MPASVMPASALPRSAARRLAAAATLVAVLLVSGCGDDGREAMVSTANRHASAAALTMLERGGSAVDAAIAAQLVLGLVEPQSSGIGGGAFLLHRDEATGSIEAYDGRETAPAAAGPDLFLGPDGEPMGFMAAVVGGRSVGVPGVVAMLWKAHLDHGRLAWAELFQPAIALAEQGFEVSPRLHALIDGDAALRDQPTTAGYFFIDADGDGTVEALPVGHVLKNPAYAETLKLVAAQGPDGFYEGPVAEAIVETAGRHANAGLIGLGDLAGYEAKKREALCRPYRSHTVCGMPPPTSGGLTTLMILGLIEPFAIDRLRPGSPVATHLIAEASGLAYADRGLYMADADFVDVPVEGLLERAYLRQRARLIDPGQSMGTAAPGEPASGLVEARGPNGDMALPSTSHLAVVDAAGNAVSMTTSVEGPFGAHLMAAGFVLNNQLTDFSFRAEADGRPVANRVEPGKRPRSSMSPTIVLDGDGRLFAAIGSPGGSRIIAFVTQTLVGLIDWGLPMQEAIDQGRHADRNGALELEAGTGAAARAEALRALGHEVKVVALTSGLHGIRRTAAGLDGGADRRREGVILSLPAR